MSKRVIVKKQGNYLRVFRPGTKVFTARNSAATCNIKTKKTWGNTDYFKHLWKHPKCKRR